MSISELFRRRVASDRGFTLIEVMVALSVFAVVAVAALPLLVVGLKASGKARVETLAKDLSQLRLERLRNLPFQVDRQNGPFVDLLDRYATNATGVVSASGEPDCTGIYLPSSAGTAGAPSGPAYRVTCASLPEAAGFQQVTYVQFLQRTGVPITPPAIYDSQVVGRDSAPSKLVGVTVLTTWNRAGQKGSLRTYTEMADARSNRPLITTQAQAVALRVTSNSAADARSLVAQTGEVKVDGSLTTGSVASVQSVGARLAHLGFEEASASVAGASAPTTGTPANPAGTVSEVSGPTISAGTTAGDTSLGAWVSCGWGWFGKSAYGNASSTTALGIPTVPSDTVADVTATSGVKTAQSGLLNSGNGCQSYAFGFRNWLTTPSYASALGLSTVSPLVYVKDPNAGGSLSSGRALGEAAVSGTDILAIPHTASAIARASTDTVFMLPTLNFPEGLVTAKLTSSKVVCKSGSPVTAAYSLLVSWPGGSKSINYPSATAPSLPDPASIAFTEGGQLRKLSDYLEWSVSPGVTESTSGAQSVDHVFGLTSPESVVGPGGVAVQLGSLSCTAADNR